MPFLRILPAIITGILIANAIRIPFWVVVGLFAVSGIAAAIFHRREWSAWPTVFALLTFSMGVTYLTETRDIIPKNSDAVAILHITDNPQTSGRWTRATAVIEKYRLPENCEFYAGQEDGDGCKSPDLREKSHGTFKKSGYERSADQELPNGVDREWRKANEKVVIRFDTAHRISVGDRIAAQVRITPVTDSESYGGYANLMRRRGYSASAWVYGNNRTILLPGKTKGLSYYAAKINAAGTERLKRLRMKPDEMAVCAAMTTGARQYIGPRLRESYNISGASHLLAVSGLHVGIVAMLANLLLGLIPMVRYGHRIRNIAAIIAIWLYAVMAGLSPSTVRAALMFSGVQLSLFTSRQGGGLNGLLGTAAIMLLINPNYLYDVSFQLSFVAVLGIFLIYPPLFRLFKSRFKALNAVWSIIIIGVAASVATLPLVSYYFGRIPLVGILINPAVIITANIIVLFSLIWIIAPIGFLNGLFSSVAGFAAGLQNSIVEFTSRLGWASARLSLSAWQAVAVYALFAAALILISYAWKRDNKETVTK